MIENNILYQQSYLKGQSQEIFKLRVFLKYLPPTLLILTVKYFCVREGEAEMRMGLTCLVLYFATGRAVNPNPCGWGRI